MTLSERFEIRINCWTSAILIMGGFLSIAKCTAQEPNTPTVLLEAKTIKTTVINKSYQPPSYSYNPIFKIIIGSPAKYQLKVSYHNRWINVDKVAFDRYQIGDEIEIEL